jgi:phosphopantothenoylcysteine synthetase/decarboxylase
MNVVVTGGATIAPIDDVRLLTNVSSGRFAAAITEAWLARGARVWHIHSRSAELPLLRFARFDPDARDPSAEVDRLAALRARWRLERDRLTLIRLEAGNVADYAATLRHVLETHPIDVAILPMAVADFEPEPEVGKISSELESLVVHCRRTPKVIQLVRDWAPAVFLVGFKLLSRQPPEELIRRAKSACLTNRADLTVANDLELVRAGRHTIHLVRPGFEPETLGPAPDLAEQLVARLVGWAVESRGARRASPSPAGPNQ